MLEVGEFGVDGAEHLAVGGGEPVAGDAGEDLEDSCGGGCGAAAVLGLARQFGESSVGHGVADGAFDQ